MKLELPTINTKLLLKSFLFSLAALVGINVIFRLIGFAISNSFAYFVEDPFYIVLILFEGIGNNLYLIVQDLIQIIYDLGVAIDTGGYVFDEVALLYIIIGYLLAPIIAGIFAGYFSETKFEALGGLFLAFLVCWLAWTIFYAVSLFGINLGTLASEYETVANYLAPTTSESVWAIFFAFIVMIVTVLTFAFVPLVIKKEYAY